MDNRNVGNDCLFDKIQNTSVSLGAICPPASEPQGEKIYIDCIKQMHMKRTIPVYSTAFLNSPIMVGIFRPRIYLPICLISDFRENDIRYMLLHELQHDQHKDAFVNCLMNIATIVYWFNPVVRYALKEVRTDREVACDTFVLQMLDTKDYIDYGNTLLHFAQKISRSPFSLATGIGGSAKQIRKRILNIALYTPQTKRHKRKERIVLTILFLLTLESTSFKHLITEITTYPAVYRIFGLNLLSKFPLWNRLRY